MDATVPNSVLPVSPAALLARTTVRCIVHRGYNCMEYSTNAIYGFEYIYIAYVGDPRPRSVAPYSHTLKAAASPILHTLLQITLLQPFHCTDCNNRLSTLLFA